MSLCRSVPLLAAFLTLTALLLVAQSGGTYTQIYYPGAASTVATGINGVGDVVCYYSDASGILHGFLLAAGAFITIDVPGANKTIAYGINDTGQVVGYSALGGFTYDRNLQTFTTFNAPEGLISTTATAINNDGTIVGYAFNLAAGNYVGFELQDGAFTKVKIPNFPWTQLTSINNNGDIIATGTFKSGEQASFIYNAGTFHRITVPNAGGRTVVLGINDNKVIAGWVTPNGLSSLGLIANKARTGRILFPESADTVAYAVNSSREVVGYFNDVTNEIHGFIRTPPLGD